MDPYFLENTAVRRAFDRASASFEASAVVHGEIRDRLLERLDLVRIQPTAVMDLGAGTGLASRALKRRYPDARVVAVDLSPSMLAYARKHWGWWRRFDRLAADATALPLRAGGFDLIFSNLMLQWCNEPHRVFEEARRTLRPGGLLTFSTLGPDSLKELRNAWRAIDSHTHVHRFIDMHDLGDALVRTGFAEPVMDTERLTVTFPNLTKLHRELRNTGSTNRSAARRRGLTGRRALAALREQQPTGSLGVSLEVIYGHAWVSDRPARVPTGGEVRIPLSRIGRR